MAATAQHLLGQLADGRFPLRKLLGTSQNSAVFLTTLPSEPGADGGRDAAIKLIPEDPATAEAILQRWKAAAALSYSGLLPIHHFGRCVIDGAPCLYVVTDLADEDLGQLLPSRALSSDETGAMLTPVLATLGFLHDSGYVHGGVKPSNIHAIGDQVKLSADRITPIGESAAFRPLVSPFSAPDPFLFPASDIWSLSVTLCETLTRNLPAVESSGQFALPELPAPFSGIVGLALVEDATRRITLDEIRGRLDPTFVPKPKPAPVSPYVRPPEAPDSPESLVAAAQGEGPVVARRPEPLPNVDPLSVPLSPVSPKPEPLPSRAPIPVSSLPQVNASIGGPRRVNPKPPTPSSSSNMTVWIAGAVAVLLAVIAVPRLLQRSSRPATSSTNSSTVSSASGNPTNAPSGGNSSQSNSALAPPSPAVTPSVPPPAAHIPETSKPAPSAPASNVATKNRENSDIGASGSTDRGSNIMKSSDSSMAAREAKRGDNTPPANGAAPAVIRKILPEVSEKARGTISGTVRINVRVQLNPDGTVSAAEIASRPAPSDFFAGLALKAAQQWQFGPPASAEGSDGDSAGAMPASAIIRFEFTQTSTAAYLPPR